MVHDQAPVVSCVPYSPGGWFIPLATTQLSGAPVTHGSRQPEIRNVAPGERLGRVVAANVSDSGAVVVGAGVVCGVGVEVVEVADGAVVSGAEVVEVVVVGAAVVVVGAAVVVVAGGVSSAGSLAVAKVVGGLIVVVVVGDGSSTVVVVADEGCVSSAVVVVAVVAGGVSGSSAETASTWSDESDDSPRLVIAHTPRPPIMIPLTKKTILIMSLL